jgi:lipopolysaccharide export LptBFGC system permease protein LptF
MEIGWILAVFFIFVTLIFLIIAFFLPEWVGITGKKAQEIMKEQQNERRESGPGPS